MQGSAEQGPPRWRRSGMITHVPSPSIVQDPAGGELLGRDPLSLVIGMLLDQHMRRRSGDVQAWRT